MSKEECQKNLNEQISEIILPGMLYTEHFINGEKLLLDPDIPFEETMNKYCHETIIDKIIDTDNTYENSIKLHVIVKAANYSKFLYYRIICDKLYEYKFDMHPFMKLCLNGMKNTYEICEIVADNEMIRKMFEFLVMPDEELQKYCGTESPIGYRSTIIYSLYQFWD